MTFCLSEETPQAQVPSGAYRTLSMPRSRVRTVAGGIRAHPRLQHPHEHFFPGIGTWETQAVVNLGIRAGAVPVHVLQRHVAGTVGAGASGTDTASEDYF